MVLSQKCCRYKWEAYCGTNRRRTAVQRRGVLRRSSFFKAWKPARHSVKNGGRTAVQIGGVLPVLFRLGVFSKGVLLPHVGPAWTSQHSELHEIILRWSERSFQRWSCMSEEKNHIKDDLAFSKKERKSRFGKSWKRCGKSCCLWMDPHALFCADSGAPILKHPIFRQVVRVGGSRTFTCSSWCTQEWNRRNTTIFFRGHWKACRNGSTGSSWCHLEARWDCAECHH